MARTLANTPARMSDIAARVGCSRGAVTRVLTGAGAGQIRVGEEKARLIRQVARQLNYHPNHAAQQLKGKRSMMLGMIVKWWGESVKLRTFYWLESFASELGYDLMSAQCADVPGVERAVGRFLSRGIDGALLISAGGELNSPDARESMSRLPNLISLFGRSGIPASHYVDVDEADGIQQAVEHLSAAGRRRIALVLQADWPSSAPRRAAFIECHRGLGRGVSTCSAAARGRRAIPGRDAPGGLCVTVNEFRWQEPDVHDRVDALLGQLVDRGGADAIIAYDDFGAAYLVQSLHRRGLRVPEDVAVVGYENDQIAHHLSPPLTTVNIPVREVAEAAIAMLADAAEQGNTAALRSLTLKPKLLVRGSG